MDNLIMPSNKLHRNPDGKYVLSVIDDNGAESLCLRNVATDGDKCVHSR
jgi:hypothetical protein